MFDKLLLKLKLRKSSRDTRRRLQTYLCDYKKPFYSTDLYTLYKLMMQHGAKVLVSPIVDGKCVEVTIEDNPIDWFCFKIKYSVPKMAITIKIQVFAGAPQTMNFESDTIDLKVESVMTDNPYKRKIIARSYSFINAIAYENMYDSFKTPKSEENLNTIKKVLANGFGIIINHIIDWREIK